MKMRFKLLKKLKDYGYFIIGLVIWSYYYFKKLKEFKDL